jgi:hypothetical protein
MNADGGDTDGRRPTGVMTFALAAGLGIVVASFVPQVPETVRTILAFATGTEAAPRRIAMNVARLPELLGRAGE